MGDPAASIILSSYNQPRLLDLVLYGYACQSCDDFEIIIADDGSGPETRAVIDAHAPRYPVQLRTVWQEDKGFRKARICNAAVLESLGRRLIFSDGDCIPSRRFVEEHLDGSDGRWVVGGHVRLSPEVTESLREADVRSGRLRKLTPLPVLAGLWLTHLKASLYIATGIHKPKIYGMNFSVEREPFFAVNGYDMNYENCSKEDSDLRNRLQLAGFSARSLWHRARVFHLHHPANHSRVAWAGGRSYYHRPDLGPVAPLGLRELQVGH